MTHDWLDGESRRHTTRFTLSLEPELAFEIWITFVDVVQFQAVPGQFGPA
jgi:hypothetical protein